MSNKELPKDRRLRTIWNSNSVTVPSGYGVFQRDLLYRLLKDGWPVAQSAFVGIEGAVVTVDGLKLYPHMTDAFGSDAIVAHSRHFRADVTFSMQDIWALDNNSLNQLSHYIPYVPIDQYPVPPAILDKLKYAYKIITFSKFGYESLLKAGFTSTLIVEGVDTEIFKPQDKVECRKTFNFPQDKFIFGQIGANKENPGRKGWQEALEAFKLFHDKHPDSMYFFQTNQPSPTGFPIQAYAHYLGLDNNIMFIEPYLAIWHTGSPEVCKMLNSFDVLLHPSTTEGFGLLPVEAMSSGTPPIVNNCTSQPELVIDGVTGEVCEHGKAYFSPAQGFWYYADVNSLYDKMETLFRADRKKMGEAGRKHVIENYNIDKLFKEKWVPLYCQLQDEILGKSVIMDSSDSKINTK
jgi:glycosyltransferase involved in cell wall biosynthesis